MKDASHHTRPPRASSRATEGDSPSLGRPTTTCARLGQLGHQKVSGSEARAGSGQEAGALSSSSFTERGSLGYGSNVKWQPRPIHMRWPCTTRNHERCHSGKAMCTHVCVCECVCVRAHIYVHVCMHVCSCVYTCRCACVCIYACMCVHAWMCPHMHIRVSTYVHRHAHMSVRMCVCIPA